MKNKITMYVKKFAFTIGISVLCYSLIGSLNVDAAIKNESAQNLKSKGWITSTENINGYITRAESATLLGKSLSIKPSYGPLPFKDVKASDASYRYLGGLIERGVFVSGDRFNPSSGLTRGQAAKVIVEAFNLEGKSNRQFVDVPASHWAHQYVNILVANEVTTGKTPDTFGPNDKLSRKHFYIFVDRVTTKIESEKHVEIVETVTINNSSQMDKLMAKVYTELPSNVKINTSASIQDLKDWSYEWEMKMHPKEFINKSTLANYSVRKKGLNIYMVDNSNNERSAKQIEREVNQFASEFAKRLEGKTDEEKLKSIYNFMYESYTYSASGFKEMLVGNMWNDTLACNGLSRLAYELFNSADMKAEIIMGESHLWNSVQVNDETILFDVTSDIFLEKKYYTLGSSSSEHKSQLGEINIWDGNFDQSRYYHLSSSKIARNVK